MNALHSTTLAAALWLAPTASTLAVLLQQAFGRSRTLSIRRACVHPSVAQAGLRFAVSRPNCADFHISLSKFAKTVLTAKLGWEQVNLASTTFATLPSRGRGGSLGCPDAHRAKGLCMYPSRSTILQSQVSDNSINYR